MFSNNLHTCKKLTLPNHWGNSSNSRSNARNRATNPAIMVWNYFISKKFQGIKKVIEISFPMLLVRENNPKLPFV